MSIIDYTQIDDNTPITANVFNERYGQIVNVINGGIDQTNIKKGSLGRDAFATDAMQAAWPINSVYISVEDVNPGPQLGGNWVKFGAGRTLVGFDDTQNEFNATEKTGGHKEMQRHSHTGSTGAAGQHTHGFTRDSVVTSGTGNDRLAANTGKQQTAWNGALGMSPAGNHSHTFTTNESGSGDSGNLQPYIVVHFWKRIS